MSYFVPPLRLKVALRKESVDRNCDAGDCATAETASLSARRAWIEIPLATRSNSFFWVALRKESVDRNSTISGTFKRDFESLSARRAWIEINSFAPSFLFTPASLSARRAWIEIYQKLVVVAWRK